MRLILRATLDASNYAAGCLHVFLTYMFTVVLVVSDITGEFLLAFVVCCARFQLSRANYSGRLLYMGVICHQWQAPRGDRSGLRLSSRTGRTAHDARTPVAERSCAILEEMFDMMVSRAWRLAILVELIVPTFSGLGDMG